MLQTQLRSSESFHDASSSRCPINGWNKRKEVYRIRDDRIKKYSSLAHSEVYHREYMHTRLHGKDHWELSLSLEWPRSESIEGREGIISVPLRHAALHCPGYVALLGSDDQSWGWNLVDNSLLHNAEQLGVYPRVNNPPKYQVGIVESP